MASKKDAATERKAKHAKAKAAEGDEDNTKETSAPVKPPYHSQFNKLNGQLTCNTAVLPLKSRSKGPAPPCAAGTDDVVDEAIRFYRANVLFKNFEPEGPADLTLCYLTVLIGETLRECVKVRTKTEAQKSIQVLSHSTNFVLPGEKDFPLPGFFKPPATKPEGDLFRSYYRQLREDLCFRLIDVIFDAQGNKNKWWFQFAKRKFMNIDKT